MPSRHAHVLGSFEFIMNIMIRPGRGSAWAYSTVVVHKVGESGGGHHVVIVVICLIQTKYRLLLISSHGPT